MMESIENLYGQKKLKKLIENDHYDCYYEGVILNKEKTRKVIQIVINKQAFEDLVNIEGSFVITIFDKKRQFFFVYRSPYSTFQFFYKVSNEQEVFFSTRLNYFKPNPVSFCEDYFKLYLNSEIDQTELTPYPMVTRLLPGHLLEYSRNGIQTTRIWFIKNDPINSEESFKFKFKDTFYTVINDYLKYLEENKVGFEVSAGLDSSTILSIARDLNPHEIFYSISSIITPEIDSHTKLGNVDKISDLNNSLNLLPIQHDTSEFWAFKNIEKSLNCEEPNPLLVNFDMYQTIHQKVNTYGITHLFSGEGADEILSSSRNYLFDFFSNMRFSKGLEILNRESVFLKQPMWKLLAAYVVPTFLPKMLKYEYLNKMNTQTWYNLSNNISFIESPPWIIKDNCKIHPSVIEKHRCAVLEPSIKEKGKQFDHEFMSLVSNLNWLDTNVAKPNSVYRLYPFKDKRLIELAFNVEFELKMDLGLNKRGLRETFNNIIPRNILEKPDQSQFEFITRNGINKEWLKVENLIKNSVAADYGWIDKEKLMEAALNYKFGKKENVNALVRTLGLEIWLQNL